MKSHLRNLALALCSLFVIPGAGAAVTYNDLWWIPAESGWGVTISQDQLPRCSGSRPRQRAASRAPSS